MKKILLSAALCLSLVACDSSKKDYAIISGTATNLDGQTIKVVSGRDVLKEITPNQDGTFQDTIQEIGNGKYLGLSVGRNMISIFLEKEGNLVVNFDQSIQNAEFQGSLAENSKFLAQKDNAISEAIGSVADFWTKDPENFKSTLKELVEAQKKKLNETKLSEQFTKIEGKTLDYFFAFFLKRYPNYHRYYTQAENAIELPENFMKEVEEINYDNAEDFDNVPTYQPLLRDYYSEKMGRSTEELTAFFEVLKGLKSQNIKDFLTKRIVSFLSVGNENNELIYNFVKENSSDKIKEEVEKTYSILKNLNPGSQSVGFEYENYKGGKTSLESLKGKFVYIDVWATWCGPCMMEVPHLIELEKKFHGKDIEFVSISVDDRKDYEKWKQTIESKGLGGIQLFADNSWKSEFVQSYLINGIPRFILLDREGKIIDADATRPSNPETETLLKNLLK